MGEAKRKKAAEAGKPWRADAYQGVINMHILPPADTPALVPLRKMLRERTGYTGKDDLKIAIIAYRVEAGDRRFHAGFCLCDGSGKVSNVGAAVIQRLMLEAPPGATLNIVPIKDADIAWDIVLDNLRTFTKDVIVFGSPDSRTYDASTPLTNGSQRDRGV